MSETEATEEQQAEAIKALRHIPGGSFLVERLQRRARRLLQGILSHDPQKFAAPDKGYLSLLQRQAAYGEVSDILGMLTGEPHSSILASVTEGDTLAGGDK